MPLNLKKHQEIKCQRTLYKEIAFIGKHPDRGITFYSSGCNPELQMRNIFSFGVCFCGKANKNHDKAYAMGVCQKGSQQCIIQYFSRMERRPSRAIFYLVPATCPRSSNNHFLRLLPDSGEQHQLPNFHADIIMFLFITKRSCHTATS